MAFSPCCCIFRWPSYYKDTSHIGLDAHLIPVWPHPKQCHILRYRGRELHIFVCGGTQLAHNRDYHEVIGSNKGEARLTSLQKPSFSWASCSWKTRWMFPQNNLVPTDTCWQALTDHLVSRCPSLSASVSISPAFPANCFVSLSLSDTFGCLWPYGQYGGSLSQHFSYLASISCPGSPLNLQCNLLRSGLVQENHHGPCSHQFAWVGTG